MGALATIALIVIGFGLMLRRLEPKEAAKYGAAFVGVAIVLILLVTDLVKLWCSISLWQRFVLAIVALVLWIKLWRRNQPRVSKGAKE